MRDTSEVLVNRRRILWAEVTVVVFLFVVPALAPAVNDFISPRSVPRVTDWYSIALRLVHYAAVILPLLFILWVSGDGFETFGLKRIPWWRLLSISVASFFLILAERFFFGFVVSRAAPEFYFHSKQVLRANSVFTPKNAPLDVAREIAFAIGAFTEELIMRGYLITRFRELFGRTWVAVGLASLLFASYHIYEGGNAVLVIFVDGLVFSGAFLVTKSIWPGTIAHAAFNSADFILRLLQ